MSETDRYAKDVLPEDELPTLDTPEDAREHDGLPEEEIDFSDGFDPRPSELDL
jgi:hypothetical protein